MRSIWKYELLPQDVTRIEMPQGAQVLTAAEQHGKVALWAVVDTDAPRATRRIRLVGTGHDVPEEPGRFVGTILTFGGSLVWHVFDAGEEG